MLLNDKNKNSEFIITFDIKYEFLLTNTHIYGTEYKCRALPIHELNS